MGPISIIAVNYQQPLLTIAFLTSIQMYKGNAEVEMIIVDNAPIDNNEEKFKKAYPSLIYIHSQKNIGFAGGNNLGIRKATGTYILLLNNDTEITPGFLQAMVAEMEEHEEIGLLSPLIKYYDNKKLIQYAGFTKMNYFTCRNKAIGYKEVDKGQYNKSYETGYCHGAAVMCRRTDLEKAGLMDEHYFLYYEELDWCEKFKRSGKNTWFTGKATIYHKESASVGLQSPIKIFFMIRNRMLFIRKNANLMQRIIFFIYYTFFVMPFEIIQFRLQKKPVLARQAMKGLLWHFNHSKNSADLGYKII